MKKDNYFIKALNGMAYGFFCSLIIGTILKQLGNFINIPQLVTWGETATYLMGPAIGVAIAYTIDAKGLNLIAAIIALTIIGGTQITGFFTIFLNCNILVPIAIAITSPISLSSIDITANPIICPQQPANAAPAAKPFNPNITPIAALDIGAVNAIPIKTATTIDISIGCILTPPLINCILYMGL